MPKSKQRKKPAVQKGRNMYSKGDIKRMTDAFDKKFLEYSSYTIEQLETIRDSKTEKGTYLKALLDVIKAKKKVSENKPVEQDFLDDSEG